VTLDPDLDRRDRAQAAELDPAFDDDVYEDIPPSYPLAEGYVDPVPDLNAIPQEEWSEILRWCDGRARLHAVETLKTHGERVAANWVITELQAEARLRREDALRESAPPPTPTLSRELIRRSDVRQVNFRLSHTEYAELDRVARAYGVTCPRLARMLTIRGVRKVLDDV
jgi:hypothetical protein